MQNILAEGCPINVTWAATSCVSATAMTQLSERLLAAIGVQPARERRMRQRSVLIVVHDYPPIRSAGTERVLKFSQYLPEFGYRPIILTTGRYGGYPDDRAEDSASCRRPGAHLFSPVRRRKAVGDCGRGPGAGGDGGKRQHSGATARRVMLPDTKIGWLLPATRLARQATHRGAPARSALQQLATETAHLIAGIAVARRRGVPWVADLRDGWLFEPPVPQLRAGGSAGDWRAGWNGRWRESAAAVVAVTDPITEDLATAVCRPAAPGRDDQQRLRRGRLRIDRPGSDAADGLFRLTYTGAFSGSSQGRSAEALFVAIAAILREDPQTPLRLEIVGPTTEQERGRCPALRGRIDSCQLRAARPAARGVPAPGRCGRAAARDRARRAQRGYVEAVRLHRRGPADPRAGAGQRGRADGGTIRVGPDGASGRIRPRLPPPSAS